MQKSPSVFRVALAIAAPTAAVWTGAVTGSDDAEFWILAVYAVIVTVGSTAGVVAMIPGYTPRAKAVFRSFSALVVYAAVTGAPMATSVYSPRTAFFLWLGGAAFTLLVVASVAAGVFRRRGRVPTTVFTPTAAVTAIVYLNGIRPFIEAGSDINDIRVAGPACPDVILYTFAVTAVFTTADVVAPEHTSPLSIPRILALGIALYEQARIAAVTLGDTDTGVPACEYDLRRYLLLASMALLAWVGTSAWVAAFVIFYSHMLAVLAREAIGAATDGAVGIVSSVLLALVVAGGVFRAWKVARVPFFLDVDSTTPVAWTRQD